jgi:hypothetical protein
MTVYILAQLKFLTVIKLASCRSLRSSTASHWLPMKRLGRRLSDGQSGPACVPNRDEAVSFHESPEDEEIAQDRRVGADNRPANSSCR